MEPVFAVVIGVGVVGLVVWAIQAGSRKVTDKTTRVTTAMQAVPDFVPTDSYASRWDQRGIAIEATSKRVVLASDSDTRLLRPEQILGVELLEDNTSLLKTNRGSQLGGVVVGGLLLGGAGAVIGGLSGSTRSSSKVLKLTLRITTDDFDVPNHDIVFFEWFGKGADRNGSIYKKCLKSVELWHARVTQIMKFCEEPRFAKPQFSVQVANPNTGDTSTLVLEAANSREAEEMALEAGWLIQSVIAARGEQ